MVLFYHDIRRSYNAKRGSVFALQERMLFVGNMWAQGWGSIFHTVAPYKGKGDLDVTDTMKRQVHNQLFDVLLHKQWDRHCIFDNVADDVNKRPISSLLSYWARYDRSLSSLQESP